MAIDETTLLIAAIFLLAGVVKGTIGIGLPTVSVGILSQFLPPHTTIALVVVPMLVSNAWQVWRSRAGMATLRRYWIFIVLMVSALWITTFFTAQASPQFLLGLIGVAIVAFSALSLFRPPPPLPPAWDPQAQGIAGLGAGILGGFTSIWGPAIISYLILRRAERDEFVRASGVLIFIGSIPLAIGFWQNGLLAGPIAMLSAWMILPVLAGFSIGEILRRRMDPDRFRRVVLWVFLFMGFNLLRRAFF